VGRGSSFFLPVGRLAAFLRFPCGLVRPEEVWWGGSYHFCFLSAVDTNGVGVAQKQIYNAWSGFEFLLKGRTFQRGVLQGRKRPLTIKHLLDLSLDVLEVA